jgi:hypothetical protein
MHTMFLRRPIGVACVVALAALAAASAAQSGVHFSNTNAIAINDMSVAPVVSQQFLASPYPSNIEVAGLTGTITDVNVSLLGLAHQQSRDVAVLLEGPAGSPNKVRLIGDCGGSSGAITNVNLTFDDEAATPPAVNANGICQGSLVTGTFLPGYNGLPGSCPLPNPFPSVAFPYGLTLTDFDFTSPNGTWSLYVVDDCTTNSGSIAGGWSLDITTTTTAVTVASLSARTEAKGVLLRWRTGSEVDLLGFQVYRSRGQSWRRVTRTLIAAKGSVAGASYRYLDSTAKRGVPYRYRIKVVNSDGTTRWFGPVRVT